MKGKIWVVWSLMAVSWFAGSREAVAAERYEVDPVHSFVVFRAQHMGAGFTFGMFRALKGSLKVDEKNPANSSISLEVEAGSVFTKNKKRDAHVRSPDFLNVKLYPKITFTSSSVRQKGKGYEVAGKLSLHGVTKQIKVRFKKVGVGKGMQGERLLGFLADFSIKRSSYGMKKMIGPVSDRIDLTVAVEAVKK